MEFTCQQCGCELLYADQICPQCGSRYIEVSDTFDLDDRTRISVKKVDPNLYSGDHETYEDITIKRGFSCKCKVPTTVYMKVDRRNMWYDKTVIADDGTPIYEKHEHLPDHQGRGDAKKKKGGGK